MITIEQKIEQFKRMVLGHAEHALEEQIAKLDQRDIDALAAIKHELETMAARHIEEHMSLALLERKQLVAKAKLNRTHSLLKAKQQFVDEVTKALEEKARVLAQSEVYRQSLKAELDAFFTSVGPETVVDVTLMTRDVDWFKTTFDTGEKVRCLQSDQDFIGGFIGEVIGKNIRFDHSYKSRIQFSDALSGGRIFELLNQEETDHE